MKANRRLLWCKLYENRGYVAIVMILSFIISFLSLTVPWFMQYFTDSIIVAKKWEDSWKVLLIFGGIILIRYFVDMSYERLLSYVTYERVTLEIRRRVEEILIYIDSKYLYKNSQELDEKDIESILLGDVDAFRNILMQTVKFFSEIIKLIIYIVLLFYYSIPVGLLICVRIPIYYLLSNCFSKPLSEKNEDCRAKQSKLIQMVKRIFVSLPAIKTFQIEKQVKMDIDSEVMDYCSNQKNIALTNATYQEINTAINTVINIIVLLMCGRAVLAGTMTLGTMMLISNVQSRTTMPLFFFNNYYLQYKSSFPGISRLVQFLATETEEITLLRGNKIFKTLQLQNISYAYDEQYPVLQNFNLTINAGEKIILTGDNMTGKSTLLKIIGGLINPDSGNILLDNCKVEAKEIRNYTTLFLQNQENYSYFENKGSGGEVQLENLELLDNVQSPIILLDEADSSINESRLGVVYRFLKSSATVIFVTHRNTDEILRNYPEIKVLKMNEIQAL